MKNIVLIGFMGTGKTTIATKLANALNMRYLSTDDLNGFFVLILTLASG